MPWRAESIVLGRTTVEAGGVPGLGRAGVRFATPVAVSLEHETGQRGIGPVIALSGFAGEAAFAAVVAPTTGERGVEPGFPRPRMLPNAVLVAAVLVAACSGGNAALPASACDDSIFLPVEGIADGGPDAVEVQASAGDVEAWGLLWAEPPLAAGEEVKMVWRVGGTGEFSAFARHGAIELDPTWGPVPHDSSSFDRPGDEWGTSFTFPQGGCWEIRLARGTGYASVWVPVAQS